MYKNFTFYFIFKKNSLEKISMDNQENLDS